MNVTNQGGDRPRGKNMGNAQYSSGYKGPSNSYVFDSSSTPVNRGTGQYDHGPAPPWRYPNPKRPYDHGPGYNPNYHYGPDQGQKDRRKPPGKRSRWDEQGTEERQLTVPERQLSIVRSSGSVHDASELIEAHPLSPVVAARSEPGSTPPPPDRPEAPAKRAMVSAPEADTNTNRMFAVHAAAYGDAAISGNPWEGQGRPTPL